MTEPLSIIAVSGGSPLSTKATKILFRAGERLDQHLDLGMVGPCD